MPSMDVLNVTINVLGHLDVQKTEHGYFHCDRIMFMKLKAIHKAFWRDVRRIAAWLRWAGKAPQNRYRTRKIRDAEGRPTGKETHSEWLEPELPKVFDFALPFMVRCRSRTIPDHLNDYGIRKTYSQARHPVRSPEKMFPLLMTKAQIETLYARVCAADPSIVPLK